MLKFLPIGVALATVFSTQSAENLLLSTNARQQEDTTHTTLVADAGIFPTTTNTIVSRAIQRSDDSSQDSNQVGTLVVLGAIGATAAVAIASSAKANKNTIGASTKNSGSFDKASPKLQKRLMTLLHNDRAAANRLIANIQLNHPHQSVNWAIEKAIYDLERDRGGR